MRYFILPLVSFFFFNCSSERGEHTSSPAPGSGSDTEMVGKNPSGPGQANPPEVEPASFVDAFEVQARFKETPAPRVMLDKNQTSFVHLMATVTGAKFSVDLGESVLDLAKASSAKIVSPDVKGCVLSTFSLDAIGGADEIVQLEGRDQAGQTDCQDFVKAIQTQGLQLSFTDVPVRGRKGTPIQTVSIEISNQ